MPVMRFVGEVPPRAALWTSRLAFFSVLLLAAILFLHRVFSLPTPIALNAAAVAFGLAAIAVLLGIAGAVKIWRDGSGGTARVVAGLVVGLGVLAVPLAIWSGSERLPTINDLTTDTASPPALTVLAKARGLGANSVVYPGASFAKLQSEAYPDLQPLLVERSSAEAFEVAADALRRQKLTIVREDAPGERAAGEIEAYERTLVLGFYDDVAIRVSGDDKRARIDLRSSSRYGRHDFGRNAERMRRILREIVTRLEATVPTASGERFLRGRARAERLVPKRLKGADPRLRPSAGPEAGQKRGLSPSSAQRGLEPKASPPSQDGRRSPDRRREQQSE